MGQLVTHQACFKTLSNSDGQFVFQQPKDAIATMVAAIRNRPKGPVEKRIYKILRPIPTPPPTESLPFNADKTFFNKKSGVKMVEHGSNFKSWFGGKVEEDFPEGELRPLTLTQSANDSEIIADLGGETAAEVTLAEIWRLMERQANGGEGVLLNNGWANIFYVRDREGVLRAVDVGWNDDGWFAGAVALDGVRWNDGNPVFSRNS